jgi:hypothetical protein
MIQGNIIMHETELPSAHISAGTSLPITETSKAINRCAL